MKKKKEDKKEYQKPNVKILIQGLSEKYGLNFEMDKLCLYSR